MPDAQSYTAPTSDWTGQEAQGAANDPGASGPGAERIIPTDLFRRSLADAEELLSYAAQTGRFPLEAPGARESFKQWVIDGVTNARLAVETETLTKPIAAAFWASYADLSRITRPVTAATLRTPERRALGGLDVFVIALVVVLIPASLFLFVNSSVATQVGQLTEEQNRAALKLWSQVQYSREAAAPQGGAANGTTAREAKALATATQPGLGAVRMTPDELFADTVEFARRNHWLRETAVRLNSFILPATLRIDEQPINFGPADPEGLTELNVSPRINTLPEIQDAAIRQILMYQKIRNFSQAALKIDAILYSGITTYLLPALYALLGAALYGLRNYARMVQLRAYSRSSANTARYFIALIAGTVIGLFGSLLPQTLSLPPLAVAFLVGYAVEAFFSRLDGFIARFTLEENARPAMAVPDVPPARPARAA